MLAKKAGVIQIQRGFKYDEIEGGDYDDVRAIGLKFFKVN